MRFFICTPLAKKRALQKMERLRVLHIFLRSCQQELNNIFYLRIQIYVPVCPLKTDLGFYLFSPIQDFAFMGVLFSGWEGF